jgi:hypothetical protein
VGFSNCDGAGTTFSIELPRWEGKTDPTVIANGNAAILAKEQTLFEDSLKPLDVAFQALGM